jgi:hypothetical protein
MGLQVCVAIFREAGQKPILKSRCEGGAKLIKGGNIVVDRDYNAARGIFLRALRDPALTSGCMA